MLTTFRRQGVRHAAVIPAVVIGLVCLAMVSAASGAASKPSITILSIGSPPASARAGSRIMLRGNVRNRSDGSHVGKVTVSLRDSRTSRSGLVVARKVLNLLGGGRSASFTVVVVVPRTLPDGRYRVILCVRSGGQIAACKQATRLLRVVEATPSSTPKGTVFQTIGGFGSSSRVLNDPHVFNVQGAAPRMSMGQQDALLDALYVELGLTRIRPVQPDTAAGPPPVGIEVANDNSDPSVTDLTRFTFAGRRLDDHAALVVRVKARGVKVAWISPLNREPWMGVAPGRDVSEYAEWLLAQVRRFSKRGGRLDYLSIANEPSYSRNTMSGEFIRDVIKSLGPRLKAEGLLVPFVVPDDVRASAGAAKTAIVLADPVARRYVGALATHLYDEPLAKLAAMRSLAERYSLPLWMTEFAVGAMNSMRPSGSPTATPLEWALLMHDLLAKYDLSAIDYFWGYIGAEDADQGSLIKLEHDGTTYRGFTRTKVFYYFGQYSRFIRPGALRVEMASSNDSVRATAYYRGKTRTIVAINPGSVEATTTFRAADLAGVRQLSQTRTSQTENWAAPPAVSVTGTSVTVSLPPHSVTTLNGTTG